MGSSMMISPYTAQQWTCIAFRTICWKGTLVQSVRQGRVAFNLAYTFSAQVVSFPLPNQSSTIEVEITVENCNSMFISHSLVVCAQGYSLTVDLNGWLYCIPCIPGTSLYFLLLELVALNASLEISAMENQAHVCHAFRIYISFGWVRNLTCAFCSEGSFASTGQMEQCNLCGESSFTLSTGSSFCQDCPTNSITINEGSSSIFSCVCPAGTYGKPWESEACKPRLMSQGSR
jgi:hypothetical protein